MKKILAVLIVVFMMLSLSGCSLDFIKDLFDRNQAAVDAQTAANVEKGITGSNAGDFIEKLNKDFLFNSKIDTGATSGTATGTSEKDIPTKGVTIKFLIKYNANSEVISASFSATNAGQLDDSAFSKGVRTYLGYCATMPFSGAEPKEAKNWVQKCIDEETFKDGKEKSWNGVNMSVNSVVQGGKIKEIELSIGMGTAKPEEETTTVEETTAVNPKYIGIPGTKATDVLGFFDIASFSTKKTTEVEGSIYTTVTAQKALSDMIELNCSVEYDEDERIISATVKVSNNSFLYTDNAQLLSVAKTQLGEFAQLKFEKAHPANSKIWVEECIFYESFIPDGKTRAWSDAKFEINYSQVDGHISAIWLTISKYYRATQ
ncbi:MAG: hypothetical protein GX824_00070 [Clostridiales bacterium]|nr:hypothetical protein [Clostridiales bacterium]